ncbi:Mu homology domain-containing protein [Dipodascopsis tothii]|uniref:Mu homology domain-containing protein n=1 Tax=Dipodascopsis tothii TaxID=44089 RepID=UPI0034CF760C
MISAVLLYNMKGEVLISRSYRDSLRKSISDLFRIQILSNPDVRSPVTTFGTTTFCHVKNENIYLVALSRQNVDVALVFEFLYKVITLARGHFGKFDEEAVKNNFTLIYELLDEIMDFGYPQNTDSDTLKMYVMTESVRSGGGSGWSNPPPTDEDATKITMQATGAMSWRRDDIKYRRNEVFVDVFEDVNLLMTADGNVLRSDVTGQIVLRAYLTGMPECRFGLNDSLVVDSHLSAPADNGGGGSSILNTNKKRTKAAAGSVTLEDCQFHQCVRLGRFDADRTISFIPPDGEFELMRYRAIENISVPFKVHVLVNQSSKTKIEYQLAVKATFGPKLFATGVSIVVPTPLNATNVVCRVTQGKAKYEPSENAIVWKIASFPGGAEFAMSAEANLTQMTNTKVWSRPPVSMQFSLLMYTSSGLLVRYLKVFEKSNYTSIKWVRYIVRAGNYEIRF